VTAEPSTPESEALATNAAHAQMGGNPQAALTYAARAVDVDRRDPWAHYDKAIALAHLGNVDDALKSFAVAESRFAPNDVWARSIAIYGAAHTLATAGRCEEAKKEFFRYSSLVRARDPRSADMALRYADACRSPAQAPGGPSSMTTTPTPSSSQTSQSATSPSWTSPSPTRPDPGHN
jgi:tetratricopeptide (TPR) repeat protein